MNHIKVFGIKTICINGTNVNTFNISLKCNQKFRDLASKQGIVVSQKERMTKKQGVVKMDNYSYTTMSMSDFNNKVEILGNILFHNAQNKVNEKYDWCNKKPIY